MHRGGGGTVQHGCSVQCGHLRTCAVRFTVETQRGGGGTAWRRGHSCIEEAGAQFSTDARFNVAIVARVQFDSMLKRLTWASLEVFALLLTCSSVYETELWLRTQMWEHGREAPPYATQGNATRGVKCESTNNGGSCNHELPLPEVQSHPGHIMEVPAGNVSGRRRRLKEAGLRQPQSNSESHALFK